MPEQAGHSINNATALAFAPSKRQARAGETYVRYYIAAILSICLTGTSQGQDTDAANIENRIQAGATTLRLASVVEPGETPAWGDFMRIQRPFGPWTLLCDVRPSLNKRICSTEQAVVSGASVFVWRIAMDHEFKPVVLFSLPGNLDVTAGIRLGFAGLEKTIIGKEWTCNAQSCIAAFPFAGFVQAAILDTKDMHFTYRVQSGDTAVDIQAVASMEGFPEALEAAAKDPFGKFVQVSQPKVAIASPPAKAQSDKVDRAETSSVGTPEQAKPPIAREKAKPFRTRVAIKEASSPKSTKKLTGKGLY